MEDCHLIDPMDTRKLAFTVPFFNEFTIRTI